MVTPCDETPMHPHDVQPDELDVAIGIDRMQQALEFRAPGRAFLGRSEDFFAGPQPGVWMGKYRAGFLLVRRPGRLRIQTAPAAGALVAAMIKAEDPGPAGAIIPTIDPMRFR